MKELIWENRQWWDEGEHKPDPWVPYGRFREFSKFPSVTRDVTVTKKPNWEHVTDMLLNSGLYLEKMYKIGEYKPKNNETFRLIFQSKSRTLTEADILIK